MRVVFLGTPRFALPALRELHANDGVSVVGVFTQPDRKSGRGRQFHLSPVKRFALERNLPVFQPERIKGNPEASKVMQELNADVAVVVAFGQILPKAFFDVPRFGTLNIHASLLPAYRGAAPVVHAILNGESETGVTLMKIDAGMDTGDVLVKKRVPLTVDITAGELESMLAALGAQLLIPTLQGYLSGEIVPKPQPDEGVSYAPMIKRSDGRIDWTEEAQRVHNRIRAMNPRPGAYFRWHGKEVRIWSSSCPHDRKADEAPGTVVGIDDDGIAIACAGGTLVCALQMQLPNRKRLAAREFANGVRLEQGEMFG
jgi:methionyl-tRNA formyltransferase